MAGWVEVPGANGKRFLMNVGNALGIAEGDDGRAILISITGAGVQLGEMYERIAADTQEGDGAG